MELKIEGDDLKTAKILFGYVLLGSLSFFGFKSATTFGSELQTDLIGAASVFLVGALWLFLPALKRFKPFEGMERRTLGYLIAFISGSFSVASALYGLEIFKVGDALVLAPSLLGGMLFWVVLKHYGMGRPPLDFLSNWSRVKKESGKHFRDAVYRRLTAFQIAYFVIAVTGLVAFPETVSALVENSSVNAYVYLTVFMIGFWVLMPPLRLLFGNEVHQKFMKTFSTYMAFFYGIYLVVYAEYFANLQNIPVYVLASVGGLIFVLFNSMFATGRLLNQFQESRLLSR